jgi:hypothetical protein
VIDASGPIIRDALNMAANGIAFDRGRRNFLLNQRMT